MPQQNDARINEISKHAEHAADRAQTSHQQQPQLTPQESERQSEEHSKLTPGKPEHQQKQASKK